MTSSGLEMPPVQKAFQRASILERISPVSMVGNYYFRAADRWWRPRKDTWRPTGDCAIVPPMRRSRTMMRRGEGDCSNKMQQNAGESLRASAGPSLLPWPWAVDAGQTEKLKLGKRRWDH